jgi:uncharacterized membrane protein YoaT (DUF817 family)
MGEKKTHGHAGTDLRESFVCLLHDLTWFALKQAWACLFGGTLLFFIIASKFLWRPDFAIARYDFLFVAALLVQALLVLTKLETLEECKIIFLFHIIGTVMELFKTDVGSWSYPEASLIRIGAVPLFSGFMYSSVGSYIARCWRIFDFHFTCFPNRRWTALLCLLIYVNFFTHHYIYDIRYLLFAFTAMLFGRTWIYFRPHHTYYRMPLLLGFVLVALFIWFAENMSTFCTIWVYPSQKGLWHAVPFTKIGAWFLLMIISFVLVSLLHKNNTHNQAA